MKQYEEEKYELWRQHVEQILPSLLKRNLLIKPADRLAQQQHHQQHHQVPPVTSQDGQQPPSSSDDQEEVLGEQM